MRCNSSFSIIACKLPSLLLLFLFFSFPSVISTYIRHTCNNASTYPQASTYSTNLNQVLNDLIGNASRGSLFNTSIHGVSPNKVYGLLQCIGNISANKCSNCSREANNTLQELCPDDIGGRVWMDDCFLRYDNSSFISKLDTIGNYLMNVNDVASKKEAYASTTSSLLSNLSNEAYNDANKRFGVGSANYSTSQTVYGRVQCWRDLSMQDCRTCLFTARNTLENCCSVKQGAQAQLGSCTVRYEIYPFFDSADSAAEASSPPPPTSTPPPGITMNGKEIAVKRLSARSTQGKKEFMNEVKLVANIQHRNLVKLLGCCAEGDERMLVYEYLHNKSLDTFLFDPEKRKQLDWQKRYNIILGIARGLLYLHEDSLLRIVDRDIKSNDILLDEKLNPKIADFGLARLFPEDQTQVQTRVAGTYGYMAPEYAMRGQLSVKADVYSFGVVLLEIVSGRKNKDIHLSQEMHYLLEWAWRLYKRGDALNMVDSTVKETCPQQQALRCIHVGLLCVQADPTVRPAMSNVNMMISRSSVILPNPIKPAFINITEIHGPKLSSNPRIEDYEKGTTSQTFWLNPSSASGVPSVNETSVTQMDPR